MDQAALRILNYLLDNGGGNTGGRELNDSSAILLDWIKSTYGLKNIAYITTDDRSRQTRQPTYHCTYPLEWQEYYQLNMCEQHDPALIRGLSEFLPFEWGLLRKPTTEQRTFFRRYRDFRLGDKGFCIPIRDRNGSRALITMTTDIGGVSWRKYSHQYRAELQRLSFYMHERFSGVDPSNSGDPRLTARETEILQWAAAGKSTDDIASIFGVAPRTVSFHSENAVRKLNCVSRTHAVAKATSMQLILPTH
ncbi:MAG: LuxR family transcriptional regulator [Pseudomonadota bacterium]